MKEAIVLLGSANSSGVVWAGVFLSGYLVRAYVGFLRRHPPVQADLSSLRELVRRQRVQQRAAAERRLRLSVSRWSSSAGIVGTTTKRKVNEHDHVSAR